MKKMSLEALQSREESVVSNELLSSISGGTENACHDDKHPKIDIQDATDGGGSSSGGGGTIKPRPTIQD